MNFGKAIESAKKGSKVSRKGWNGKEKWITVSGPEPVMLDAKNFWNKNTREFAEQNGGKAEVLPYFLMKTADNKVLMGWLASQSDMLAEDWGIIE